MADRASSPMFVDDDEEEEPQLNRKPANTLAKTLVQIHSMINAAEQEAELNHRLSGHLNPVYTRILTRYIRGLGRDNEATYL